MVRLPPFELWLKLGMLLAALLLPLPAWAQTQLPCGQLVTASIAVTGEEDRYAFNGAPGDEIVLRVRSTTDNFNARMWFYDPAGAVVQSSKTDIKETLSGTGVYAVVVKYSSGTVRTGDYGLFRQNLKSPCQAVPLSCGTVQSRKLAHPAKIDTYTYTAAANDAIRLQVFRNTAGLALEMELYLPNGLLWERDTGSIISTRLPNAGLYTLFIYTNNIITDGEYRLGFQKAKGACNATPLVACQTLRTSIGQQAEMDAYTFDSPGSGVAVLRLEGQTSQFAAGDLKGEIYTPDGISLGTFSSGSAKVVGLAQVGVYTVLVYSSPSTGMIGNYTLSLGNPTVTLLTPNGGELAWAGQPLSVSWESADYQSGSSLAGHEVRLSTDGGASFPTVLTSSLSASAKTFTWDVPVNLVATRGRLRVVARNNLNATCQDDSDSDFFIIARPELKKTTHQYDELNRLIEVQYANGTKITYTYDEVGNRLSEVITVPNAPAVVATVAATDITQTSARLNGDLNLNGNAGSYYFEWGRSSTLSNPSVTPTQQIGSAGGVVNAELRQLIPETAYYFRLVSTSSLGTIKGDIRSFVTVAAFPMTTVSAASFARGAIAKGSIVSVFGQSLATTVEVATSVPLPTSLAGTTIRVIDSNGIERFAPLFFVAPTQANYQIPEGTATGIARVIVIGGDGKVSSESLQVDTVAPALFSANASGSGLATGSALRIKADGAQIYEPLSRFDPTQNKIVPIPLDLGPATDQLFLILYGSGLRFNSGLSAVTAKIGGVDSQVLYAGPVDGFVGLDQVNLSLPRSLMGRGLVDVMITADAKTANTLQVSIGPITEVTPTPTLIGISSNSVVAGSSAFTLTVNGTNFISSSVVRWNGADRSTTFVSNTQLRALISASDLSNAGVASVAVFNPGGGGGSNSLPFTITQPCTYSISPTFQPPVGPEIGNGIINVSAASGCSWMAVSNANWITITSGGSGSGNGTVSYSVAANTTGSLRTGTVTIASQTFTLTQGGVTNSLPTITSLSPNSVALCSAAFSLTVNGTGFIPGSIVQWKGSDRATSFISDTQLRTTISNADVTASGTAAVTVVNPIPAGSRSNSVNFAVIDPPVTAQTILPGQSISGSLTVNDQIQRGSGCSAYYFDAYKLTTTAANTTVSIDLRSSQFDALIILYNLQNNNLIYFSSDDYSGGYGNGKVENTNALLLALLPIPGDYVIFATTAGNNPGGIGNYTLRLDANTVQAISYGANLTNAAIAANDLQTSAGDYLDAYWFAGTAGDNVQITMRSSAFDSFLILQNNKGELIASNDNGAGGVDSQISFRLDVTGTYVILATPYEPNKTGAYTMTLNKTSNLIAAVTSASTPTPNRERKTTERTIPRSPETGMVSGERFSSNRLIRLEPTSPK